MGCEGSAPRSTRSARRFFVLCRTALRVVRPSTSVVRPRSLPTSRTRCSLGRRKSESTRSTERPNCARLIARLLAIVVFPSKGSALVTTKLRSGLSGDMNVKFVRIIRNVSAAGDIGSSTTMSSPGDCAGLMCLGPDLEAAQA